MKEKLTKICTIAVGALLSVQQALANQGSLPDVAPPSRGESKGNYIQLIQNYGYDFAILAGLAISAIAFAVVSNNVISTYRDIQKDKKEWKDLGAHAGIGAVLLVLIVYLMNELSNIL